MAPPYTLYKPLCEHTAAFDGGLCRDCCAEARQQLAAARAEVGRARAAALEEAAELCDLAGSHRFKKVAHTGTALAVAIRALASITPEDG